MKRYIWWVIAAIIVAGVFLGFGRSNKGSTGLVVVAQQGDFEILVTVSGELMAKYFENILSPDLRSGVFRVNEFRIQDMVAEGTIVDSGDWVAELDRGAASNAIRDLLERIERQEVQVETVQMDTALQLRGLRDDLLNREFGLEVIRLRLEQSIFEPPAAIRQIEIELQTATRNLEQHRRLYSVREQHCRNWTSDVERQLRNMQNQHEFMIELLEGFTIRAPRNGMVIYRRERNNQKRRVGSVITPWDNVIATLPDLSTMLSRTFVNEIDISKIQLGQIVRIGIDAFPDRSYTGSVTSIATIGEQMANSDAKVFEVMIELNESDMILRPIMTSSNTIVIRTMTDVTFIPIEAIYNQDGITFVYTTNNTKQIVVLGESNDNEIIVEQGLSPGDRVYVSPPENSISWRMNGEELIPIIEERALERQRELEEIEHLAREEEEQRNQQRNNRQRNSGG